MIQLINAGIDEAIDNGNTTDLLVLLALKDKYMQWSQSAEEYNAERCKVMQGNDTITLEVA